MINKNSKIYVPGHNGLVGSAIVRKLKKKGYKKIIVRDKLNLDLTNQSKVYQFIKKQKPDFIFIAAAKVGGIYSNDKYRAEGNSYRLKETRIREYNVIYSDDNYAKLISSDSFKFEIIVNFEDKTVNFENSKIQCR